MTETLLQAAQSGDETACETLILENSGLVWSIVRRFLGRATDADDLYQLGCVGLLKAIRGFDETLGYQFSTYAVPKIAGEIRRFLRDDGMVKVSRTLKENGVKIKFARERLAHDLGREPVLSELADACGLTPEEIAEAECATGTADSLSREFGEDGQTLADLMGDHGIEDLVLERVSLLDAIARLPKREGTIIRLRFFKGFTQDEIAHLLGTSQVQISRMERAAIKKLRGFL